MSVRKSIKGYGDDELALIVANDVWLYEQRHGPNLMFILDKLYDYTDEQKEALEEYLEADLEEVTDE